MVRNASPLAPIARKAALVLRHFLGEAGPPRHPHHHPNPQSQLLLSKDSKDSSNGNGNGRASSVPDYPWDAILDLELDLEVENSAESGVVVVV